MLFRSDCTANLASVIWLRRRAVLATQCFGQETCRRGLPCATRSSEQVAVRYPTRSDAVLYGAYDMVLSDQVGEGLGSIFAVKRQIAQVNLGHRSGAKQEAPQTPGMVRRTEYRFTAATFRS